MKKDNSHSRSFLFVTLATAFVASIVVACGTFLTPPASPKPATPETRSQAPAPTPAYEDTSLPPPTPTTAPTSTPQPPAPTATHTPAPSPTPESEEVEESESDQEGSTVADAQHGQGLFRSLGCAACHGPSGEGAIGPTISQTELSLARVIRQYRVPYQSMPRFGPDQVSEKDIADIYAFLHTLPTPEVSVPSVLANVTPEAGIGTIRGTIRYSDTGQPSANEQIYVVAARENADGSLTFSYLAHQPAGTTDTDGRFEIADVEAQLFGVFYSRQEAPVLDSAGNILLVNVLPNEVAEVEGFIPAP